MIRRSTFVDTADRLALVASGACVLHCLALPLLFVALPTLSSALNLPETFHLWMVGLAIPTSAYALLAGARDHDRGHALLIGAVGLVLLVTGAMIVGDTPYEIPVTVAGALILGMAHIFNWRRRHNETAP